MSAPRAPQHPARAGAAAPTPAAPAPAAPGRGKLFGGGRRRQELEAENAQLRAELEWIREQFTSESVKRTRAEAEITRLQGMSGVEIAAHVDALRQRVAAVRQQVDEAERDLAGKRRQLDELRGRIVETEDIALLQESGIYEYRHRLADAVAYKDHLDEVKKTAKSLVREGAAVSSSTTWSVNGSQREGQKMVRDFSKLMLRAYNAEADNCVRTVRPHSVGAVVSRLEKTRETIARLGKLMDIEVVKPYHDIRVMEIETTADYLAKQEEEKEYIRAQREQQREEEKARKEFEREKARLLKERAHFESALARVRERGEDTAELEARLASVDEAITGVENREANIRAGYVYVISNIGAFGPDMVKIGLTRRLDPQDRIRELGDASVPFKFDTHALVFSEDAVTLETRLHQEFAERRVNQVNLRREFFRVTPAEVRNALTRFAGQHLLEFQELPEAAEWRASGGGRQELANA